MVGADRQAAGDDQHGQAQPQRRPPSTGPPSTGSGQPSAQDDVKGRGVGKGVADVEKGRDERGQADEQDRQEDVTGQEPGWPACLSTAMEQAKAEQDGYEDQDRPDPGGGRLDRLAQAQGRPGLSQEVAESGKAAPWWDGRVGGLAPGHRQPGGVEQQHRHLSQQPAPQPAPRMAARPETGPGSEPGTEEPPGKDHQVDRHEQEGKVVEHPQAERGADGIGRQAGPGGQGAGPRGEQRQDRLEQSHSQRRGEGVHPHFLGIPQVVGRDGDQERGQQARLRPKKPRSEPAGPGDQQDAEKEGEERDGKIAVAGQAGPGVEQEVVAGRMDVAGGMGHQRRQALGSQVDADRLVVPQAFSAQAIQPQAKGKQQDRYQ